MRYKKNLTALEFDAMDYGELVFAAKMISQERADVVKNSMISASFCAWQQIASNGGKIEWSDYISMLGLSNSRRVKTSSPVDRQEMIKKSYDIADRIRKAKATVDG